MNTQIKVYEFLKKKGRICQKDIQIEFSKKQGNASHIFNQLLKFDDVVSIRLIEKRGKREFLVNYLQITKIKK